MLAISQVVQALPNASLGRWVESPSLCVVGSPARPLITFRIHPAPPRVLSPQDGTAPLWIASQMGHSEVVRVMLLRGAERDAARHVSAGTTTREGGEASHRSVDPRAQTCGD